MATFNSLAREAPRTQQYLPSPLLSGSYSPDTSGCSGPATPVTPPSSTCSASAVDILEPSSFRSSQAYTPSMDGGYSRSYEYDGLRRESMLYHRGSQSPTRRSPGHSPKSYTRGSPPHYHYTPYGLENRSTSPRYHQNDSPTLPWPSASSPTARRTSSSDPLAPLQVSTGPVMLPPFSTSTYHRNSVSYLPPPQQHPQSHPHYPIYPQPYQDQVLEGSSGFKCQKCRHTASSLEQLAKHQQKHQKIHRCRFQGCSRQEGFATPNDRERHEKSVHKIPGQYWKCLDESCASFGKEFSRRDNLKDHLRRMHPPPEGLSEAEASLMRSKQADAWRFEKSASISGGGR